MTDSKNTTKQAEAQYKREQERILLVSYLRVFDADTGLLLGHVADISMSGIRLVSNEPLELDRTYALKLILPKEVAGRFELLFSARSCWTKLDSNPDFVVTGFSFPSLRDEQKEQIFALREAFGRDNTLSSVDSERPACNITQANGR